MVSSDIRSAPAPPIHARGRISQQTTFRRWRQFGVRKLVIPAKASDPASDVVNVSWTPTFVGVTN
jgi:hypothetical protein